MVRNSIPFAVAALVLPIAGLLNCCALAATIGSPQKIATISNSTLDEISGLVPSRALADVFWVHNDSGDSARFFAMSRQGGLLGTFPLAGATAFDWEDMAASPKPGGGNYLYFADIGDNNFVRNSVRVYRTDEPQSTAGATIPTSGYTVARLAYPGGARNAESLFVDPLTQDLYIISKGETNEIFSAPASVFENPTQTFTMTAQGTVGADFNTLTAADISPDGRFILLRNSRDRGGYFYERSPGQTIAEVLAGPGTPFLLGAEAQGEAIGWAVDGKSFYTTSEFSGGSSAPLYSYAFSAPPLLPGDYNNDLVVDAADYAVWRNRFGEEVELPNEAETPGVVTDEDYAVWKTHYGQTLSGGAASTNQTAAVPEPSAILMTIGGVLLTAMWRGEAARRR